MYLYQRSMAAVSIIAVSALGLAGACQRSSDGAKNRSKRGSSPNVAKRRAKRAKRMKGFRKRWRQRMAKKGRLRAGPPTYARAVTKLDRDIAFYRELQRKKPKAIAPVRREARLWLERAKLTGRYADYAEAEKAIARAFGRATLPQQGPLLLRARLNFTLHRLPRIEPDLRLFEKRRVSKAAEAQLAELRGDVALQLGDYQRASDKYQLAHKLDPAMSSYFRLGLYSWRMGKHDEAGRYFEQAERRYHNKEPRMHAWFALQHGILDLDRGRWKAALAHYRAAAKKLIGWWLIEEHIAEIYALQGQPEKALPMYLDLVKRTQNPEFMDALVEIYEKKKDTAKAKEWIAKARKRYEEQLKQYPEAAYGHALEHFIAHDPARAVKLAERNKALRPNGEAWTLLAQAYLAAGRVADAQKAIEHVLATAWKSADTHAAAYHVFSKAGLQAKAAAQKKLALAINPHALD